jgi:NitT/TauT family transport system ATP-binding protein
MRTNTDDPVDSAIATVVLTGERVEKRFQSRRGDEAVALAPSTFRVRAGDFISLVGPSGCGKTTLLKICAGLMEPSGGSVTYRNTGSPVRPGTFGMVFQNPALLPWRTVGKNLLLPQEILHTDRVTADRRVEELLELVHLPGIRDRYPKELSGGMQQRVAIARALMPDPDLLFMDEPFGALDAITREELNGSLQEVQMAARKTVLFVTHDIPEAIFLADRVFVMSTNPGTVVEEITIDLPRPRTIDSRLTPAFREAEARIRHLLHPNREPGDRP